MRILSNQFNSSQETHFQVTNKLRMMVKVTCLQKIFKVKKYNKLIMGLSIKAKFLIIIDIWELLIHLKPKKNKEIMSKFLN